MERSALLDANRATNAQDHVIADPEIKMVVRREVKAETVIVNEAEARRGQVRAEKAEAKNAPKRKGVKVVSGVISAAEAKVVNVGIVGDGAGARTESAVEAEKELMIEEVFVELATDDEARDPLHDLEVGLDGPVVSLPVALH